MAHSGVVMWVEMAVGRQPAAQVWNSVSQVAQPRLNMYEDIQGAGYSRIPRYSRYFLLVDSSVKLI